MNNPIDHPTSNKIRNLVDQHDYRWFFSDSGTYIFHHEVIQSQRLSSLSFNVKLRTYEVSDICLSDLLRPEVIMVSGFQLECVLLYNEITSQWKVDGSIKDRELNLVEISTFPDPEEIILKLINRVGDDLIDQSEPEELMRIDVNKIHSSLRQLLSQRSSI